MFLKSPSQTLDVSLRVKHGEGHYMLCASTGCMKCFECWDLGNKWADFPHKMLEEWAELSNLPANTSASADAAPREISSPPAGVDTVEGCRSWTGNTSK